MTNVIGTQSFWVSQIIGGCESERVEVQAIISETPQSPITSNIRYCVNSEAVALTAIGDSLVWYTSAVGGNGLDMIVPSTDTILSLIHI